MTRLPAVDKRIDTGVVQFGDDWPGVFIRGDEAMAYAQQVRWLTKWAGPGLIGLADLLESCKADR